MNKYSKTKGHHCWWLKKDGKSLANFDDEKEIDAIIDLEKENAKLKAELNKVNRANSIMAYGSDIE